MSTLIAKEVSVRVATPEDMPLLEKMYETFSPAEVAGGLPPANPERRKNWLNSLAGGINVLAFCGGDVAGHLILMPGEHSAEMAIFVHQDFRRRGAATALTDEAIRLCRTRGIRSLWVLIGSDNNVARMGLLNYGFHTAWESMGEVRMELPL